MAIRTPIIPTEIAVHIGPPNQAGKIITVPFQEYIKNVASSELYPTWPADALKANILAQISFALNRVYNEWYRSQGYNFDITSSPVYDQNFVEDRQFFENISQIVDDIFNNYLVIGDQIQPLFASYCDGVKTTCDGLSQWGSANLAKQGKTPLEILKYYYGDDLRIIYNAPVGPNIQTYPDFPFQLGTAGNYVSTLKKQLNRISNNYPAIPKIENENEIFNVEMETAVRKFQEIFDLPVTGTVDKATWYEVKYIYNAVKKIADIASEGISKEEAELLLGVTLQYGDKAPYVRTLNYLLNTIAYFDPDIPLLNASGDTFGENTKQMVIAFQNKYDITATGNIDSNTWRALLEVYNQTIKNIPKDLLQYKDEFYPGLFLSKGMRGDDVENLQKFLYVICEQTHEIPGVRVTGIFDNLTEQSIKYIQQKYNLPVNGAVGPVTWGKIVEWTNELE